MDETDIARAAGLVIDRYLRQNDRPALDAAARGRLTDRLAQLVSRRTLPPPLGLTERGAPHEMTAVEVEPLVRELLAGQERTAELDPPARQLVKACFQPEFRACRGSYRAAGADGSCRRQQLDRARQRISGTHCVDCPYWTALAPAAHERFLAGQWLSSRDEFLAHRDVFLPEDFRTLRSAVRALAREQATR